MYLHEDRKRAVELCIERNCSAADVIRELGYPDRHSLRNWYKDYLEHGEAREGTREPRCSDEEKRRAVARFQEHGRSPAPTIWMLGYPSKQPLHDWTTELAPGQRMVSPPSAAQFAYEQKTDTVVALATKKSPAREVAELRTVRLSDSNSTLYR